MEIIFLFKSNRRFRIYFFADIVSGIGSAMAFIGFNWFILESTGSNARVGYFLALTLLSGFLFSPLAGTIVDRFDRRLLLIWSNLIQGSILLLLIGLMTLDLFSLNIIYIIAVVNGAGWNLYLSGSRAFIQEIIDKKDLIKGNSVLEVSLQVSIFVAAGLSGIVYKFYGFKSILLIDAISFFLGVIFLQRIKHQSKDIEGDKESFAIQFKNGLAYLINHKFIMVFGIVALLPFVVTMTSNAILPGYVRQYLDAGPVEFGLAEMSYGLGASLSGILISHLVLNGSRLPAIFGFFTSSIMALVLLFISKLVFSLFALYLLFGLSNTSLKIILNTTLMEVVPKSQFGRAMAFWLAVSSLLQIMSTSGIGFIIDRYSANYGYLLLGCIMIMGLLLISPLLSRMAKLQAASA